MKPDYYNNNKHSLFTINLINYTIYLPKVRELKKMKNIYKIEIKKSETCEYHLKRSRNEALRATTI